MKDSDKLLNDFMTLTKKEIQGIYGGALPEETCIEAPTRDTSTGYASGAPMNGPDPDDDIEDVGVHDPDGGGPVAACIY